MSCLLCSAKADGCLMICNHPFCVPCLFQAAQTQPFSCPQCSVRAETFIILPVEGERFDYISLSSTQFIDAQKPTEEVEMVEDGNPECLACLENTDFISVNCNCQFKLCEPCALGWSKEDVFKCPWCMLPFTSYTINNETRDFPEVEFQFGQSEDEDDDGTVSVYSHSTERSEPRSEIDENDEIEDEDDGSSSAWSLDYSPREISPINSPEPPSPYQEPFSEPDIRIEPSTSGQNLFGVESPATRSARQAMERNLRHLHRSSLQYLAEIANESVDTGDPFEYLDME